MGSAYERYRDFVNSTGFTCYACNREYDNDAIDLYGRSYVLIANHKVCDLCEEDFHYHTNLLSTVLTEIMPVRKCLACWFSPCRCSK